MRREKRRPGLVADDAKERERKDRTKPRTERARTEKTEKTAAEEVRSAVAVVVVHVACG